MAKRSASPYWLSIALAAGCAGTEPRNTAGGSPRNRIANCERGVLTPPRVKAMRP